jgi:histidinol dehydrogenase
MRVLRWAEMGTIARQQLLNRGVAEIFSAELGDAIGRIIQDVRSNGDAAVVRALGTFDGVHLSPAQLRVTPAEIDAACATIQAPLAEAIDDAIEHLRAFNRAVMARRARWDVEIEPGLRVGELSTPIRSAGLFCPSGKASYPSVLYQLGVPAVEAGVERIVVVVPPAPGGHGELDPAVLFVASRLGLTDVFRANGPAGIAAMAFGTESIPRVMKVVGPGSPAVTRAQVEVQRYGTTTMMLLGPTESMVLADEHADPVRLAADLLVEAEHGTDTTVVLITTSQDILERTQRELVTRIASLPAARAEAARAALGVNGGAVLVHDVAEGIEVVNAFAPEHLQLAVVDPEALVTSIVHAGEVLLGQDTYFSAANFVIGCPASLPTSGFAAVSSGITVDAFLKRTAIARADKHAARRMATSVIALADHEGFPAHGDAAHLRL